MPYLKLETNVVIPSPKAEEVMRGLSLLVSRVLATPEGDVHIVVSEGMLMCKGGSEDPAAHIDIKGAHLDKPAMARMAEETCTLLATELDIPGSRVTITIKAGEETTLRSGTA